MQHMKTKVVVTGGAGFIGAHLAQYLLDNGYEIHVVDNLTGGKKEKVPAGAVFYEMDVRDGEKLTQVFKDAEFVFHLAALPRVQFSLDNPKEAHDTNVNGTLQVLISAKEAGVKRVIFSSSGSVYGDQPVLPLVETMDPAPQSPYALHKSIGEQYAKLWSEVFKLPTVCLRYFNVYGPGQDPEGPYALVVGKFIKFKKEGKPLTITSDGKQTRDFTHVKDVVRANLLAAKSEKVGKGEAINIGAGREQTVNRLAELMGGPTEYIPARLEPRFFRAGITKAKELLNWHPEVLFEDGIAELLKSL